MWAMKEIVIFLTGAQAFHTLTHIIFLFSGSLPMKFFGMEWTYGRNLVGLVINILVTIGLFWIISRMQ